METMMRHALAMFRLGVFGVLALAMTPTVALAGLDDIDALSPAQFKTLSADLVAALSHKSLTPAEPLGITGFDIGIGLSVMQTDSDLPWSITTGDEQNYLMIPRISIHKGLPLDIDVGGFYATVPGTGIHFFGGEIKYALLEGNVALPAVALRGAATRLSGIEQLDLDTRSVEIVISKGLANLTPYAGVGRVWGDVTPSGSAVADPLRLNPLRLNKESPEMTRVFAGVNFSVFLGSVALELEKTGENFGASAKIGIRF